MHVLTCGQLLVLDVKRHPQPQIPGHRLVEIKRYITSKAIREMAHEDAAIVAVVLLGGLALELAVLVPRFRIREA